ncbi:helix-turn-helix domain-containing protein [Flavobacterium sp.]|uniref:helix-turn-helix domain-containing protein n=1 Tax=Flavobacterium sp. TaxID=239 RepID=UPI003753E30E
MHVTDKGILARIKEIRTKKGYSQEYVAMKLGIKQAGYSSIEAGKNGLSVIMLLQIAIILEEEVVNVVGYPFKYIKEVEAGKNPLTEQLEFKNEQIHFYKEKINLLEEKLQQCENEKKHTKAFK